MGDLLLSNPITLSEVWIAYRKAKFEAYKDKQCAQSFKFVKYEQEIANNLASAFDWLSQANHEAIGEIPESRCQTIPKSLVSNSVDSRQGHFAHYDNISTWKQRHKEKRAGASFRQIIDSPVNVQLLDTLWCMRTGEKLDRLLSNKTVFANRLRRRFYNLPSGSNQVEPLNLHAHAIFKSYVSQYGLWRQLGLDSTRSALEEGKTVVVFTLDISSYYNSIDIDFLDNESFLEHFPYEATAVDVALTESIANLIKDWRTKYLPDPNLGIPIGLRSSCIIANAYLAPFDNLLSEQLSPIFYGRYVDDIFLCLQVPDDISIKSPSQAKEWLCSQLSWLSLEEGRFKLTLPYAQDHPIYFGTEKERVFLLKDDYGITLIDTIKEHMSKQSSEFRLLPTLDDTEAELYDKVLLLSRDPSVLGANFREAEELTLRRSGLAEVLRRFEIVCGLLPDEATTAQRNILCKLLHQHLLTPQSLFDFYSYVPRFFNLMVKHGDVENIKQCLIRLKRLRTLIEKYTDSTPTDIERSFETLYRLIEQAMIQSAHAARNYKSVAELISLLPDSSSTTKSIGVRQLRDIATQFWLSDWSSTRVAESLQYIRGRRFDSSQVPMSVRQLYHFGEVSSFLQKSTFSRKLSSGNWRGLFFPTRPMRVDELSRAIPPEKLYTILPATETYHGFETSLFGMACTALCGRRIKPQLSPRTESAKNGPAVVRVGGARTRDTIVAVSSLETTDQEWKAAALGTPSHSLSRYNRLAIFLNSIISSRKRPHYAVLPELSLPIRWLPLVSNTFGNAGISVIAGLEYEQSKSNPKWLINCAAISSALGQGYGSFTLIQQKKFPAWGETVELRRKVDNNLTVLPAKSSNPIVYIGKGLSFGVVICSDLTDISYRANFRGIVDALFVIEWNKDVSSFSTIVEASALDIHAYIVQCNNRVYGDGRIRGPLREAHARDILRLKGGIEDYFVAGIINAYSLRAYQSTRFPNLDPKTAAFKPYPIGFEIAKFRKLRSNDRAQEKDLNAEPSS